MSEYEVRDLTAGASALQGGGEAGSVDLDSLREQLEEIRDSLTPVVSDQAEGDGLRLQEIELSLAVGLEGKVWFVAKGTAEASLKLTFGRPDAG